MGEELTLEILEEAMSKLPPITYPKRMRISYYDYRWFRAACDFFGILPEKTESVSPGFGMDIVPDIDVHDGHYEVDW